MVLTVSTGISFPISLFNLSNESFTTALNYQHQKLVDPSLTPSARMLKDMIEQELEINELLLTLAQKHRQKLHETENSQMLECDFAQEAEASLQKQKELEESETLLFDDFHRLTFCSVAPTSSQLRCSKGTRFQCTTLQNSVVQPASCS